MKWKPAQLGNNEKWEMKTKCHVLFAIAAHTIPFDVVSVLVLSFILLDGVRIPSKAYYCKPDIYLYI